MVSKRARSSSNQRTNMILGQTAGTQVRKVAHLPGVTAFYGEDLELNSWNIVVIIYLRSVTTSLSALCLKSGSKLLT